MSRRRRRGGDVRTLEDRPVRRLARAIPPSRSSGAGRTRARAGSRGDQRGQLFAIELARREIRSITPRRSLYSVLLGQERMRRPSGRSTRRISSTKRRLGDDVLDRLERDHCVEARVGERQRRAVRLPEFEIRDRRVTGPRVVHGRAVRCRRRYAGGARGEERAAVALAARDVEDVEAGDERGREMVAVPMLVPDLAGGAGDEALAGEFEFLAHWMTFALRRIRSAPSRQAPRAHASPQFYARPHRIRPSRTPWPPPPSARMSALPTSRAFSPRAPPPCQRRPPAALQDASGRTHC